MQAIKKSRFSLKRHSAFRAGAKIYLGKKIFWGQVYFKVEIVNIAAMVKCLVLVYLLFNVCYFSPTTEPLTTVMRLLNDYSRIYPHADRREVARCVEATAEMIRPLESLVRQMQMQNCLLNNIKV